MSAPPDLVFDASIMLEAPMSGIPRVMHAVAGALLDDPAISVRFCRFDPEHRTFEEVPSGRIRALVRSAPAARDRGWGMPASADPGRVRRAVTRMADATPLVRDRPATARVLLRGGSYARRAAAEIADLPRAVRADRHRSAGRCFSDTWTQHTVFCSLGLDRDQGHAGRLAAQRARLGFRTLLTVYDLIPIVAPQFVNPDDDHPLVRVPPLPYREHFALVVGSADHLLVISEATRRDVEEFAGSLDVPCPPTSLLPLGSTIPRGPGVRPRSLDGAVQPGRFALSVGTVEIRKNHHLLLDVWEMLLRERPRTDVPHLVVVGKRGWLFEETHARLTRTPAFAGTVHHVEDATDDELAWCYRNALVTCMPSLSEGWGLPVSESLAVGTPCLTSDTSSLPEAGQGCTDLLDPYDRTAWRDRILEVWDDPAARERRVARIAERFSDVTVRDTAGAVLDVVHRLQEQR